MRPRKKDPSFLRMAALAAVGGIAAIVFAIGFPLWQWRHGQPYRPAFSLFAAWGIFALCGAYACLRTYYMTDPTPPKPPGGGVRLEFKRPPDAQSAAPPSTPTQRAA